MIPDLYWLCESKTANDIDKNPESPFAVAIANDADTSSTLVAVLEDIGFSVRCYPDAEAAVGGLCGAVPALVVLDSTNDEACRGMCQRLFHFDGFGNVALVMLVNDNDRKALNDDFEAGATNVFVKPCAPGFLRDRLCKFAATTAVATGRTKKAVVDGSLSEDLPDIAFEIDSTGRIHQCIAGADRDSVLKPAEMCHRPLADFLSTEAALLLQSQVRGALKSRKDTELDVTIEAGDRSQHFNIRLIVRGRDRLLAIFRELDLSGKRPVSHAHRMLDTLTRLTTRDLFLAEVDANLAGAKLREQQLAVICVDLDRFTKINDTLGRAIGDIVLRESAERLRDCLGQLMLADATSSPPGNVPIARMAGDEFICMLENVESRDAVAAVAERIRRSFDEPITVSGAALNVTPSIGIALFPPDGGDAETLCNNARTALDEARFKGVDSRAFFTSTVKFRSLKRPDLIKELGWAIEKDQLELHYLPRIDLKSGDVTGLEALLRWMHPLRGSVPLSDVIPLAEVSGLMRPLGEWILTTACAEASAWAVQRDSAPGVSINLSADEFSREDLPQLVEGALKTNNLGAGKLQFELAESLLVRYRHSQRQLQQLQALGAKIVIDDFGTGHSSLALLSKLPIDAIKIDRSFVEGAHRKNDQAAVCAAIIAMAHELGICVIAEGVETDEQLEFLLQKGCDAAQGFLYSRPLPAADVMPFLDAYGSQFGRSTISNLEQARLQVS